MPSDSQKRQDNLSKTEKPIKVIVGMSGGVDSSVAAYLLQQQGYAVEGLFMKNWDEDDGTEYCTAIADLEDAQQVCDQLGIVLHTANFATEYWDNVFSNFLHEYQHWRTLIQTFCATERSSLSNLCATPKPWAQTTLQPVTTFAGVLFLTTVQSPRGS